MTTIRQPKAELGWVATNLLLEESLRGAAHAHREVMFQPELVVRATTRRVAGQETDDTDLSAPDAV